MFDQNQKTTARLFARTLVDRDYKAALALCSDDLNSKFSPKNLGDKFETVIPLDWGSVDPIKLEENPAFPFLYITLGGDVYSEAIIVHSFVTEKEQLRIASFELGRP